jgi:hypothetical protein
MKIIDASNYRAQLLEAERWHARMIRELEAGGFKWNAQTRQYEHPDGTTVSVDG